MLCFILCVALCVAQAAARPAPSEETSNGLEDDQVFGKIYKKFKIPQVIVPDSFRITINGTLHDVLSEGNADFSALLTDGDNQDNCRIDIKNNVLKVSPALDPDGDSMEISQELLETHGFSLKIFAREVTSGEDIKFFDITFNGMNNAISCTVKDFTHISFIVIKEGVKNVTNMLFEFEPSE